MGLLNTNHSQECNQTLPELWNSSNCNGTSPGKPTQLPREMLFNDDSLVSVVAYSVLFVIAAVGNLTVFLTLSRSRKRRSRVNLFILHLAIADLIVTFVMLPLEIGWHITVSWKAGDMGCRLMMFFRAFGFYLSSFVLIAISLDRYYAIVHPLSLTDAGKRSRIMLLLAWLLSFVASIPQSVIFHVEKHPMFRWFAQCVTFNFFPTAAHELAYNLFNIMTLYVVPLVVIIVSYALILWEMSKKTRESRAQLLYRSAARNSSGDGSTMRRSGVGRIEKARIRTLKMTIVIVAVFIMCWTPYFIISAWWWFHKETAMGIDTKIQRGLFIFAVSNSCMNPIVYGVFSLNIQEDLKRCCCHLPWRWKNRGAGNVSPYHRIHVVGSHTASERFVKTPVTRLESPDTGCNLALDKAEVTLDCKPDCVKSAPYVQSTLCPLTILHYDCSPRMYRAPSPDVGTQSHSEFGCPNGK